MYIKNYKIKFKDMKQKSFARLAVNQHQNKNQKIYLPLKYLDADDKDLCIAKEILEIYKNFDKTNKKSDEWVFIDENMRKDFIFALNSNDQNKLALQLCNFFIDNSSYGIITPALSELNDNSLNIILDDIESAIEFADLKNYDAIKLKVGSHGNPFGLGLEGDYVVQFDAPRHLYYAKLMISLLHKTSNKSILEIGGGFGGLIRILRKLNENNTYYIIDLLETGLLAYYFLKKLNVPVEIVTECSKDFKSGVVYIIPTQLYKNIDYFNIGLVVNFNSFSEMSKEVVDEYFEFIQNDIKPDFILHQNSNFLLFPNSLRHIEYMADDFPIDNTKYELNSKYISPFHGGAGRYRIYSYFSKSIER